jgi:hypothetical protein
LETIELQYPAARRAVIKRARVGVVGSGEYVLVILSKFGYRLCRLLRKERSSSISSRDATQDEIRLPEREWNNLCLCRHQRQQNRHASFRCGVADSRDQLTEAGIRLVQCAGICGCLLKDCARRRKDPSLQDSVLFGENGSLAMEHDLCVSCELPAKLMLLCIGEPSDFVLNEDACLRDQPDATTHCAGIYNEDAFALPAPYTYGDFRRNIVAGPDLTNVKFAMGKAFDLWPERGLKFQIRASANYFLNHPSFAQPGTTLGGPPSAEIGGASINGVTIGGRVWEMYGRLSF